MEHIKSICKHDESGFSSEDTKDESGDSKKFYTFHRSKFTSLNDSYLVKSLKIKSITPINLCNSFELGKFFL